MLTSAFPLYFLRFTVYFQLLCEPCNFSNNPLQVFLLQNPPSVPTLIAVKWASILKRSAFIIDWHNFGHTLLALSLGRNSSFVAVYRWY